jgi:hypothetical protein
MNIKTRNMGKTIRLKLFLDRKYSESFLRLPIEYLFHPTLWVTVAPLAARKVDPLVGTSFSSDYQSQ